MRTFDLTILGCSSATPTTNRHPTAQLLNVGERYFLIDCGEGTQMQLRKYKIKFQRIDYILISHLHGDHYLGLIGLLQSMHLLGREKEIHLFCPPDLKTIIDLQNKISCTTLNYNIVYHFLHDQKSEVIFDDEKLSIETIPLNHRIPTTGFLFIEKIADRKILIDELTKHDVSVAEIYKLKKGLNAINNSGQEVDNHLLTTSPSLPRKYAFCSDTLFNEKILAQIENVDLLYHEATFLKNLLERAQYTFHSTAEQAATIALKANVKKLIIGHFSARYTDLTEHLKEAREVFSNTILANEGEKITI